MTKVIKTVRTFDGFRVQLTADGVVHIPSIGSRRLGMAAGLMLLDEACLYDLAEMSDAAAIMKRAHAQTWVEPLTYFRNVMGGKRLTLSRNSMGSVGAISFRAA
jgi:hypothetical protein